jgi:hypothetical protein
MSPSRVTGAPTRTQLMKDLDDVVVMLITAADGLHARLACQAIAWQSRTGPR